jgi:hypothetical protein
LEKALSALIAKPGTQDNRHRVEISCAELEAQLEFIWDDRLRAQMSTFTRESRDSAAAYTADDVREHGRAATTAWNAAKDRAGEIWRALIRSAIDTAGVQGLKIESEGSDSEE